MSTIVRVTTDDLYTRWLNRTFPRKSVAARHGLGMHGRVLDWNDRTACHILCMHAYCGYVSWQVGSLTWSRPYSVVTALGDLEPEII